MTNKALLVIDIQIDNVSPSSPYPFPEDQVSHLIQTANSLISRWEETKNPVFLIRHNFDGWIGKLLSKLFLNGITIKGEPGTELDPRIQDHYGFKLDKSSQDCFKTTDLTKRLNELGVTEVYICGLDEAYCIAATTGGALDAGFKPYLIRDAMMTTKPKRAYNLREKLTKRGAIEILTSQIE